MPFRVFSSKFELPVLAGCLLAVAGAASAENTISNAHSIDAHFDIASKDFGGGVVQLHSRQDGASGTTHTVHNFDCVNKSFAPISTGDSIPDAFPLDALDFNLNPIDENSAVAPLAQHACKKHGYPVLEW